MDLYSEKRTEEKTGHNGNQNQLMEDSICDCSQKLLAAATAIPIELLQDILVGQSLDAPEGCV